jgi:signal transduction histidine kinase
LLFMLVLVMGLSSYIIYQDVQEEQTLLVSGIVRLGNQYLDETNTLLHTLSSILPSMRAEERTLALENTRKNYPRFTTLYVLDKNGIVLNEEQSTHLQSVAGFDFSGEEYFKSIKEYRQPYISSTFFSLASDDVAIIMAHPILAGEQFEGVLVGELNLYNLQETIQRMSTSKVDTVFIVDDRGTVLAHPNRDLVRQQSNMGNIAVIQEGSFTTSIEIVEMDGAWVLASAAPIQNGWVVITTRSVADAARPLALIIGASLTTIAFSIIIFGLSLQRTISKISAPITRLAERADDFSRGKILPLTQNDTLGTYQELLTLNESFERMLLTIQVRTTELVDINQQLEQELKERQRIAVELRRSEARYRGLFENSPIAIWEEDFSQVKQTIDTYREQYNNNWGRFIAENQASFLELAGQVRIIAANRAAMQLYGIHDERNMPQTMQEAFVDSVSPTFYKEIESIWFQRTWLSTETNLFKASANTRHVILQWSVLPDYQETYERVLLLIFDITERKQAEIVLRQHREQLEELVEERTQELTRANQELESFAYTVSHDLRAPLRHINGFTSILLNDYFEQLDESARKFLNNIRDGSQNMTKMIDGLLQLSRMSRGDLHYSQIDLSALVAEIANELQSAEPERKVSWQVEPGCLVRGDERLLRAALQNLLDNAWKFTIKEEQAFIEFARETDRSKTTRPDDNAPLFYVRDNGVGFDMNYASKLFTPFQRLHNESEFAGTGIGLATVQRIVRKHGGEIWCQSQAGEGTTFYFTLE